jgi:hypothetical protein
MVDAPDGGVADVKGSLAPANHWLDGSPAGSPDGWRLTAGFIESSTNFSSYQNFSTNNLALGTGSLGVVETTLFGPTVTAGLQGRWLTALLDARFQIGRQTGTLIAQQGNGATAAAGSLVSYDSTLSQWSVGVRPGVRLPLVVAALSTGVGIHIGQYCYSPDTGTSRSGIIVSLSYWIALDAQPFCEWGIQIAWAASTDSYGGVSSAVGNSGVSSLWGAATYTPNTMCSKRRAGLFKIEGTTR